MSKLRIIHYINQFFANTGDEEKVDYQSELREGIVGPGMTFNQVFGDEAEIVTTVICGDPYFNENAEAAKKTILDMTSSQKPGAIICGPAFNAGRYGVACGTVALAVKEELNIPALTGVYKENPSVDVYKTKVYTAETRNSAAGMRSAVVIMALPAIKLAKGEKLGLSKEEGHMPNGTRINFLKDKRGSQRAVEMLVKKLAGKESTTESPAPDSDRVDSNPAVKDMVHVKIVLVVSSGIVPKGNPDHIESSSVSKYGKYDADGTMDLTEATYGTAHGGCDPVYANEDAGRALPVDVLRGFEKEGRTGSLHRYFYTTVGNDTFVANVKRFAAEFVQELRNDGVDAVVLTST